MHKPILVGLLLTALGSFACGSAALADGKPGDERPPPPADAALDADRPDAPHGHGPGAAPGPGFGPLVPPGPPQEVIHTATEIEHLYREQGRPREVIALYQDILAKARDPLVRGFAYEALARAQQQPVDTDKAIATLRQSLGESLQRLQQPPPGEPDGKGM